MISAVLLAVIATSPAEDVWQRLRSPNALEASFEQTKHSPAFIRPLKSSGRVLLAKPDRLRLEYQKPAVSVVLLDGDRLVMHHPGVESTQVIDLKKEPELQSTFVGLLSVLQADFKELKSRFVIEQTAPGRVVLRPKHEGLKDFLTEVRLQIDLKQAILQEVELVEAKGAKTHFRFFDVRTDPKLKQDAFRSP